MRWNKGILAAFIPLTLAVSLCPFSSAFANSVVGAGGFIDAMASAAGMSSGDFIATTVGVVAVGSGMNLANEQGIKMGQSANANLSNLIDAADYPDWDTLSDSKKANYENDKSNYDAAKFNSLMSAFGLGDAANRYYGFTSSGGANWEADWTENELSKLQQLGEIGTRWAQGLPNKVNEIYDSITHRSYIENYFPPVTLGYQKKDTDTLWPSTWPNDVNVYYGNEFTCKVGDLPLYAKASSPVYCLYVTDGSGGRTLFFDTNNFKAAIDRNPNNTYLYMTDYYSKNGVSWYMYSYSDLMSETQLPVNTVASGGLYNDAYQNAVSYILGGGVTEQGGVDEIEEYPEDIQAEANVDSYYPEQGVVKNIGWPQFLVVRQPVIPETGDLSQVIALLKKISTDIGLIDRTSEDLTDLENAVNRFQFYANNILKVHDEGVFDSLTNIGTQLETVIAKMGLSPDSSNQIQTFDWGPFQTKSELLGEELENLAPFGAIFLVSNLVETVSEVALVSEPKITVPFNFFEGHQEEIEIDVSWIDDGRAVINVFVILSLMLSLAAVSIRFIEIEVG